MSAPPIPLPPRERDAHKGDFGRVVLVGGSRGMAGSISLSSIAALQAGTGAVIAAVPDACLETVAGFHPAIMTIALPNDRQGRFASDAANALVAGHLEKVTAIGAGPGMTTAAGSVRIVDRLLTISDTPRVLDADALNVIGENSLFAQHERPGPVVLTPHPGELQRLTGASPKNRSAQIESAQELAVNHDVVVVVKGGPTIVVDGKDTWTCPTGNPGMATAGSGDVLTGVITGLAAQGLSCWDAARLGVWAHGRAGDIAADKHGQSGMTALEILDAIPAAINEATD